MPKTKSRKIPVRINPYSLPIPKSDPTARAARAARRATMNTINPPQDLDENGNPRPVVVDPNRVNPVQQQDNISHVADIGSQRASVHSTHQASHHGTPRASHHGSHLEDHEGFIHNRNLDPPRPQYGLQPRPVGPLPNFMNQFNNQQVQHQFEANRVQNQQQQDVFNWIPPANQFAPNWEQPAAPEQFAQNWGQQPLRGGHNQFHDQQFPNFGIP